MGLFKKKKESALQELPSFGEDNHSRKEKGCFRRWYREKPWIFRGLAVSMAFAVVFSGFYGIFSARAEKYQDSPMEGTENISWLYQSSYLLYRDLYNARGEQNAEYTDIYLEMKEGYRWLLDDEKRARYGNILSILEESVEGEEILSLETLDRDWMAEAAETGSRPPRTARTESPAFPLPRTPPTRAPSAGFRKADWSHTWTETCWQ